jgi:hypothetical protein
VTGAERRALGEFDATRPNIARMNDYLLGGKDNFAADRRAAEQLLAVAPEMKTMMAENRKNTHEVAHRVAPASRVVYGDNDPIVISHGQAILACDEHIMVVEGDILHPEDILAAASAASPRSP